MSNEVPTRGVLTDSVITWLRDALAPGALVGDGIAPEAGGWNTQGEPNLGAFVPYTVVKTGAANPAEREGTNRRHASWLMAYGLDHFGALRNQCDYLADIVRALVTEQLRADDRDTTLLPGWKVQEAYFGALGSLDRTDAVTPSAFTCRDVVVLRVERSRT